MTVARPLAPLPAGLVDHAREFEFDRRGLRPINPRVSVVVPAKAEAANIREILPYLNACEEVIVVVGRDDDESAEAARTTLPSAKIVRQTRKGKGNAMVCGFKEVTGDVIVTFDVDGSADPHEIPRFVSALTAGADLAKGSRFCAGGGSQDITQFRALGNHGLNILASGLTSTRFTDLCYGFNAFWADQLPLLDLPEADAEGPQVGDGFEIEAMIIGRFALSKAVIVEVPSYEHYRYHGETNLNAIRDGFRVLWTLLRDRMHRRRYRALAGRLHPFGHSKRRPNWMLNHPRTRVLQATSCPEFPDDIRRTLDQAWVDHDEVPEVVRMDIAVAATEVGNNILEHAGGGRDLRIRMEVRVLGGEIRVEFTDDGLPAAMDLESIRMPEPMAESGRGLALAQALLSDLSYSRDNEGHNHWTLVSQRFG
jgi:glycosyltransferase involved in cell wall biosynthesis/anti-sigma regulatory factor (Ser/Thr protein kinase)